MPLSINPVNDLTSLFQGNYRKPGGIPPARTIRPGAPLPQPVGGRPAITNPPVLDDQLRQYDEAAQGYYDKSRSAYKQRVQMATAGQRGQAMAGLERAYSRGTGGEFGGGEMM